MRFAELEDQNQRDLQPRHRPRSRVVGVRKSLLDQRRAILLERGFIFRQGRCVLEREVDSLLAQPPEGLSPRIFALVADMRADWRELDCGIAAFNDALAEPARADPHTGHPVTVPGVGVVGATAMVAALRSGDAFRRARDLTVWRGSLLQNLTADGSRGQAISFPRRQRTELLKRRHLGPKPVLAAHVRDLAA